jgi:ankyrin repeat protein
MDDTASELIEAAEQGDAERVRWLLAENPGLADTRKDGMSLLLRARYRGDRATTDALRSSGRRLDIFEAATFDDHERIEELLAEDPELATAWSPDGFTALHLAAFMGGVDGARLLIDAGADLNAFSRNDMQVAPIHSATAGRAEVAMLLVERGADVNVRQRHGWTPLQAAAHNGHAELVEALLAAGADADATNDDGVTATDLAQKAGHEGIARRLRAETEAGRPQ